jgi:hypothetical protein
MFLRVGGQAFEHSIQQVHGRSGRTRNDTIPTRLVLLCLLKAHTILPHLSSLIFYTLL